MSNLTTEQYNELLFSRDCSLMTIEHLDVYHVLHWTPEQFFARKSGNVLYETPVNHTEPITFIILIERGTLLSQLDNCNVEDGERIVVSFRKAIQDRIGYAFVSLQKRKIPIDRPRPKASLQINNICDIADQMITGKVHDYD